MRGVFIRAPRIRDAGAEVKVLGELDGEPVLVRDRRLLLASFHPELTDDPRVHELFLEMVREAPHVSDASLASVPRGHGAQHGHPSEVQRREGRRSRAPPGGRRPLRGVREEARVRA